VIEHILPSWVAAAEAFADPPDLRLFPEEAAAVAGAVPRRVREFATARSCARRALDALDVPPVAIPVAEGGAPRWPPAVVGSITHCTGYRAAAVSRQAFAVGIDAEPHEPLPTDALPGVATEQELRWMREFRAAMPSIHWDRLLFSAKESVYKVWSSVVGEWLDFQDAVVSFGPSGTFHARLVIPAPCARGSTMTELPGRWLVSHGLVLTTVVR